MASAISLPNAERTNVDVVHTCYDVLTFAPVCGLTDFTDGKYIDDRNDHAAYLAAQARQAEYLLDQANCGPGSRLLDIGCGYGRIMEHAARRGANAVGITISPPQVANCRAGGLDVRLLNYRDIFSQSDRPGTPLARNNEVQWVHAFDAVIANGSLEHFVQVADALERRADEIYGELFAICHRLLADGGRFVTTAIHFRKAGQFDPARIARGHRALPRGSDEYQFAILAEAFGGWYPDPGQLQRCADPYFDLVAEEDGTHDYHLTSEYWVRRLQRSLALDPRTWWAVGRQFYLRPRAAWQMLRLHLWDKAWVWQFRPPAPMQLLRQTWQAK
jgi:cyclopropane fatty-acyl-phospholipid synthase-like methyltransferase